METTSFPEEKSSRQSSSLSFITFDTDDWKTTLSFENVKIDIVSEEESFQDAGGKRLEVFRFLWHEVGFVFSISMSQILTVFPLIEASI